MDSENARKKFYDLVWPHAPAILRTALILTHNQAEADDLAQETMLKAFKFIDSYQHGTNIKAWLLRILRNTRIDHLRSTAASRTNVSLDQLSFDPEDTSPMPVEGPADWHDPEAMLAGFSDQQVVDALRKLPAEIRWTLLLVDVEGLNHGDAAEILEVPVGTVKSRTHRGRTMLRVALLPVARDLGLLGNRAKLVAE